jgi:hypothetical protein
MKPLRIAVVAIALAIVVWITITSMPLYGAWQASVQRDGRTLDFHFHVSSGRSINGWLDAADGSYLLDNFQFSHNLLSFDLALDGHRYHLQGSARDRHIDGTWNDETGATGSWSADKLRRR